MEVSSRRVGFRIATEPKIQSQSITSGLSESVCLGRVWKLAAPRHGGRRLWQWSFTEFCEMVLRAAWTALGVRRSIPANQPLDNRFFR
jgi:hypothetical protein